MVLVDVARTGACLLPLLARTPALLPFAYLGVIGISIGSAYFEPASQAALPNIVAAEELGPANVLMGSTWGTMLAVGAAIGGAVTMRFGRDVSFVVDAISFLVSAGILWMMRARFNESREHHDAPPLHAGVLSVRNGRLSVSRVRLLPSAFMTQMSKYAPSRVLVNAIRLPSGDQVGS